MANAPKGRYTSFESVLHRLMHERIDKLIVDRALDLGNGSARKDDSAATAAHYHEEVGFIRALRECQQICEEIAKELSRDG